MNLLIFCAGILVGIVLSGSIFAYLVYKKEPESDTNSIKAMKDYIFELESEVSDLKETNKKLRETIIRGGY